MKQLSLIILLFAISLPAYSQDGTASSVLGRMERSINALGDYMVEFSASSESGTVTGSYMVSGTRYRLLSGDIEIVSDGRLRYEINHEDEEIIIEPLEEGDKSIFSNPASAFEFATGEFTISHVGETSVSGTTAEVIRLMPRDKSVSISQIEVYVGSTRFLPVRAVYYLNQYNERVTIDVRSFGKYTSKPTDFSMDLKAYPGYDIIDFR